MACSFWVLDFDVSVREGTVEGTWGPLYTENVIGKRGNVPNSSGERTAANLLRVSELLRKVAGDKTFAWVLL